MPKRTMTGHRSHTKPHPLHIVGIGASAGGLEALRALVAKLPLESCMGYVIAQHLAPQHRSLLTELLARETSLEVIEAKDDTKIVANTVYITPPNKDVYLKNGRLRLRPSQSQIGPKPSIDYFLTSLAKDCGERAIGIILSGTGSDGAHGMRAIKAEGGIAIAQNPVSAQYSSMPNAAIRIGAVDLVLAPDEMATQLRSIVDKAPQLESTEHDELTPDEAFKQLIELLL